MSRTLILNLGWVAVAAGAFLAGKSMQPATQPSSTADQTASKLGSTSAKADEPKGSTSKATPVPVSKEDAWLNAFLGSDDTISPESMGQAVEEVMKDNDPVRSSKNFALLLEKLTNKNAEAALKMVREKSMGFESMRFLPLLGYAWGQQDPKAALAAFDTLDGREGGWSKGQVMSGWATKNPDEAIAYLEAEKQKRAAANPDENNPGGGRGGRGGRGGGDDWTMERGVIGAIAATNATTAMDYVMKMDENRRGEYVGVIAGQKMKEGAEVAASWALGLGDAGVKSQALTQVGQQYARQNLDAALTWATTVANIPEAHEAVGEIADTYAEKDPTKAYAWAQNLDVSAQKEAMGEVFSEWAQKDPQAAAQELMRMQASAPKNEAIESFSERLARESPQDAMTWATTITDEQQRQETQLEVAREWARSNNDGGKAAADQWAQSNLTGEALQQYNQPPQNWGRGPRGGFGGPGR